MVFNQKSTRVEDIDKKQIMPVIKKYTAFLEDRVLDVQFGESGPNFVIDTRIKNNNSIDEKLSEYMNRDEKGKVSINKCYNDLFGIRAIVDCDELDYKCVNESLARNEVKTENKDQKHKILGVRYKAIHLYFKNDNNTFSWELQIWRSCDEKGNQESHVHHRYQYRNWESENKQYLIEE